jgi:predicted chitinase
VFYKTTILRGNTKMGEQYDKDGNLITTVRDFDRDSFFSGYRSAFGSLTSTQVSGLESLLSAMEQDDNISTIRHLAYMLATVKHETANTFHPISEYGSVSYFNRYDPVLADTATRRATARANGNTVQGDGYKYRGRGYVQITWKNNYKRLGDALGYDLVNYPERALESVIAYKIMSYGMRNGIFTGKKLSDYITSSSTDYYSARRIINGTDKASTIKSYAEKFERILNSSLN